jgi:hypothetical protein
MPREVIPQDRLRAVATPDQRGMALQETWTGVGGGKVTDLRGEPYVPGAGSILASNLELHPLILEKLDAAA